MVTENFFSVLDMEPVIGRFFTPDAAPRGANPFAVLSYASWRDRFGSDPSVVGRIIRLNGTAFTVAGVAPKRFKGVRSFGFWPEVWVPAGMHRAIVPRSQGMLAGRGRGWLFLVGRMHDGWDIDQTRAAATLFAQQLEHQFPDSNRDLGVVVLPARSGFDNPQYVKPQVLVLVSALGIVGTGLILVVICANLANLQLARAAARSREFAIRLSLGCSRLRLTSQLLVETFATVIPGLVLAAAIVWAAPLIESLISPRLQFRVGMDLVPNVRIALFTTAMSLGAVLVLGLIPAFRATRTNLAPSLATVVSQRRLGRHLVSVRGLLVVSQLAISVVLLVGATLFARSFFARTEHLGLGTRDRLLVSVNVGLQGYDPARGQRFYQQVLDRVRANSAVISAAWAFPAPFDTQDRRVGLFVEGAGLLQVDVSSVSNDFVNALGLHVGVGRGIEARDTELASQVMVISRSLATRLWPGTTAVGQKVRIGNRSGPEITVVGVVDDARFESLGNTNLNRAYMPLRQQYRDWQTLVVHTRGSSMTMLPSIREVVAAADPALPVFGVTTLEQAVESGFSSSRAGAMTAAVLATIALLVAAIGLYAVIASSVHERTREIGIRLALGSTPRGVMRHMMGLGLRLGAWGLVLGLCGALALARAMAQLLFGVAAFDAVTFATVPLALFIVVLVATYLPAHRAVKLEPMTALRTD
jgi:putative ABC transport system permease protein